MGLGNLKEYKPAIRLVNCSQLQCQTHVSLVEGQDCVHTVQLEKLRSWQPPQALTMEYVTELHLHGSASANLGPR